MIPVNIGLTDWACASNIPAAAAEEPQMYKSRCFTHRWAQLSTISTGSGFTAEISSTNSVSNQMWNTVPICPPVWSDGAACGPGECVSAQQWKVTAERDLLISLDMKHNHCQFVSSSCETCAKCCHDYWRDSPEEGKQTENAAKSSSRYEETPSESLLLLTCGVVVMQLGGRPQAGGLYRRVGTLL